MCLVGAFHSIFIVVNGRAPLRWFRLALNSDPVEFRFLKCLYRRFFLVLFFLGNETERPPRYHCSATAVDEERQRWTSMHRSEPSAGARKGESCFL